MSLIDEALKRARMEAARKAAESENLPYPAIPRHLSGRPRRPLWLVPAVVVAALAMGTFGGWLLTRRTPDSAPQAGRATAEAATPDIATPPVASAPVASPSTASAPGASTPVASPTASSPPAASRPVAPTEVAPSAAAPPPAVPPAGRQSAGPGTESSGTATRQPRPVGAEPAAADASSLEPPTRAPVAAAPPNDPPPAPVLPPRSAAASAEIQPPPAGTAAPRTAAPDRAEPEAIEPGATVADTDSGLVLVLANPQTTTDSPSAEQATGTEAESHVQRFATATGATIELGGIAWSETGPFALINGRVVGTGDRVEEFTIERIGPGHVELRGAGGLVRITLQ